MAAPVTIRPMIRSDIDLVIAAAAATPGAPHWPRASYERTFAPGAAPHRIALIAEAPACPIAGFLVASLIPPQAELESIFVTVEFQRHGIATALFRSLESALRAHTCSELILEVRQSNRSAQRFYLALGFTQIALRPAYYSAPVEDAVLMSRPV